MHWFQFSEEPDLAKLVDHCYRLEVVKVGFID